MFDPSFFELLIICVVALLVLGPDRLPGAIKTMGLWIGRLRRSFNNIRREIEQEVGADEIRRQLRNEAIMEKFNSTKSQITESIDSVKKEAESIKDDLDLSKEMSGSSDDADGTEGGDQADELDPIEKLATNDPSARTVPPKPQPASGESSQEHSEESSGKRSSGESGEEATGESPENTDEPGKQEKPQE